MTLLLLALLLFAQPSIDPNQESLDFRTPNVLRTEYDRREWKHWIGSCLDTRERVLIAESRRPVTFKDACTLLSGEWLDPYTGEIVTAPGALDCDHVIPLAAAHKAGGWRWDKARKQAYANDLHPEHLVAVLASANRQKGSKGPDRWRPRRQHWCDYANAWLTIAARWNLTLTPAERQALAEMRATCAN